MCDISLKKRTLRVEQMAEYRCCLFGKLFFLVVGDSLFAACSLILHMYDISLKKRTL